MLVSVGRVWWSERGWISGVQLVTSAWPGRSVGSFGLLSPHSARPCGRTLPSAQGPRRGFSPPQSTDRELTTITSRSKVTVVHECQPRLCEHKFLLPTITERGAIIEKTAKNGLPRASIRFCASLSVHKALSLCQGRSLAGHSGGCQYVLFENKEQMASKKINIVQHTVAAIACLILRALLCVARKLRTVSA